jgi:hypothetical protein
VRAHPEVEPYSRVAQWVKAGFEHAQANPLLGIRLPVLFGQAGIAEVGALGLQAYWPPESRIGPAYAVGVVRALKSAIEISVPYLLQCSMDEFASRSARTIGCGSAYPRAPFPRLISGPA